MGSRQTGEHGADAWYCGFDRAAESLSARWENPMLDTDADLTASLVGKMLGGYTIETLLGQGGMSAVFRAHQASLQRDVALKVLPPDKSQDSEAVQRFIREA